MKLTRSQLIVLVALGVLTIVVYTVMVSIFVRNSRQISQMLPPTATLLPTSADRTEIRTPSPTSTAAPTPTPTPTPTPIAPQTRYDLQVADDPENPTLRLQRGYAYIKLEAHAYAVEDFDVAIDLDDAMSEAYLGRGEALFYLKQWSAALEDFDRALALNPDLADAHAWRGYLLSERREHRPALEALRQAVALEETDPRKHMLLAQTLLRSGSPGEAKIEYTTVISLEARSIEAYVGRAMAWAEQGDFDAALADLDSALEIAPHDPLALNGQAWFYAWYRHSHLGEAERLARRAVTGAEDDLEKARYLHTLGWVYYQQKRYEEAVAVLEESADSATIEGQVVYKEIAEHLEEVKAAQ